MNRRQTMITAKQKQYNATIHNTSFISNSITSSISSIHINNIQFTIISLFIYWKHLLRLQSQ